MGVTPPAEGPQKKGHATKMGLLFSSIICDSVILHIIYVQVSLLSQDMCSLIFVMFLL